jgi:hypothetical protein
MVSKRIVYSDFLLSFETGSYLDTSKRKAKKYEVA